MKRIIAHYGSNKAITIITAIGAFVCSFYTESILATMVAIFAQIFIHETGHMIFGLLTGYKFYSFRFLSFMIYKDKNNKLKFKLFSLLGTSGQCIMLPPETEDKDTPYVLYNMGGVIINFITMPIFTALYFAVGDGFLKALLFCLVIMGFTTGLTNGIPLTGYISNDGMNALNTYKSDRAKFAFKRTLKIHVEAENGLLVSEIPDEWLVVEDGDITNAITAQIPFLAAYVAFMKKDFEKARALSSTLISFESQAMDMHKFIATMLIMYCEAVGSSKKSVIAGYESEKVVKFMRRAKTIDVIRTKYAVELLVKNDVEKAEKVKKIFNNTSIVTKDKRLVGLEQWFYEYVDEIYTNKQKKRN